MARVYGYRVVRDFGFAPNPFGGWCTLATCKPGIRRQAEPGDLVIGCGSAKLRMTGRLLFAMRVQEKLTFEQYWKDPRFFRKRPYLHSGKSRSYGDNIYYREQGAWKQTDSHHSFDGGEPNALNMNRDLSADAVLISTDFTYWGTAAKPIPRHLRDINGEDLFPHPRGYRNNYSDELVAAVSAWFEAREERGLCGRPASW